MQDKGQIYNVCNDQTIHMLKKLLNMQTLKHLKELSTLLGTALNL